MINLYDELPKSIKYRDKEIKILPYFNRVIFCLDVFKSKEYTEAEKTNICFDVLVEKKIFDRYTFGDRVQILNIIFNVLFGEKEKSKSKKTFDFSQDAKYIYAGFMQTYGIDLFNYKNKLHWLKFVSLFQGLPQETKIMQIIDIRTRPIPVADKYNSEYINNLLKLKAEYQLELTQEEREKEIQEALGSLFGKLKAIAEKR